MAVAPARDAPPRPHRVVALASAGMSPFELVIAAAVFGERHPGVPEPWYRFRVASATPGPMRTTAGFGIVPDAELGALRTADTVVVPAWPDWERPPDDAVLAGLRRAAARGARVVSICTGAFALGHAGLLDGRRATTHWAYCDALARLFPAARVEPDVLYVDEGDLLTSAGSAAGLDLCLHLVRRDHGTAVATAVARHLVVPPHRQGGQAQYTAPRPTPAPDIDGLAAVTSWAVDHLDGDLSVEALAARAAMSPRTFARRFAEVLGTTPHRWVVDQRVDRTRELLETTTLSVEAIARATGFASPSALRARFAERVGVPPGAYRRTFPAPGADARV